MNNIINIVKSDGSKQPLDVTKIHKMSHNATKGLEGVDPCILELDSQIKFINEMSSADIQDALIRTAIEKIDVDSPNWTFVASRLTLFDLYHIANRAISNTKSNMYPKLATYIRYATAASNMWFQISDGYDLDDLDNYIEPDRDFQFTYLGIKTLKDRYLLKNTEGIICELPQFMFMTIAMFLAQNEDNKQEKAKEFYDVISKFEVMLATPTLSNARTQRHQLSSCFSKGTLVQTINGNVPIDELNEGDLVLTHNKRYMSVYELLERKYAHNMHTIKPNGMIDPLTATAEHPVYSIKFNDIKCVRDYANCVFSQNSKYCHEVEMLYSKKCDKLNDEFKPTWNAISQLELGDYVSISYPKTINNKEFIYVSDYVQGKGIIVENGYVMKSRAECSKNVELTYINNQTNKIYDEIKIDEQFMLLLGYYLAEGHINKSDLSIQFTFSSHELDYINECKSIIESKFKVNASIRNNFDGSTCVNVNSKILGAFFNKIAGTGFNTKILCNDILFSDPEYQKYMLVGVIRGDGCAISEGYKLTLANDNLIKQLHQIALRCKLHPFSWKSKKLAENATVIPSHLKISRNDKSFIKLVGKNIHKINDSKLKVNHRYFWLNDDYFMKIESVSLYETTETVYNIEVEEDHSYSVNGIDVHNCYVGSVPDSIEGIFDTYKEMALLSKFGGGIGWDFNFIRSIGGTIDKHKGAAGGAVPFLKITNDIAIAVDQLGTRKGAISVYLEPWHIDIEDFIDLKKNSGEERRRAHDLFPALWLNDIFSERIINDDNWTLFDPYDVPELNNKFGNEFNEAYLKYESDESIRKVTIKAKDLWKKILRSYFESGSPFLCFKDTANERNSNNHTGMIRSSNLCTEIYQNTAPDSERTKVTFENGSILYYDADDQVVVGTHIKPASKLTSLDYIGKNKIAIVEKVKIDGKTAVCNLASVNLSVVNTKEDIDRVVPIAIEMLDNVVSLNYYPYNKVRVTNMQSRSIGLGVMGEAQMLAEQKISWGSIEHLIKIDKIMEAVSYNAINASADLAAERGTYPEFEGSKWSNGILPIDTANEEAKGLIETKYEYDWDALRNKVKNGIRNGYIMAIAPTSSISILVGTTQAIEPVYKRKWYEENLSGQIPVTAPNLNTETWNYYTPAYDVDQLDIIKVAAIRQKWIDQGQSLNIFMRLDKSNGKYLNDIYMLGWKLGLKSTYYLRSQSPEVAQQADVADRSIECIGCQ